MCGIAGKYFFNKSQFHDDDLGRMLDSIRHRGPDSEGRYSDGRTLLGFRRLSIIDTTGGNQPLFSEDKEVIVVANGEIYNYLELKNFLVAKGHRFRTGSDSEIIVHLYEEFGREFVSRLNGMFAFCLYDRRREKLLLGRDRVGIKPLYFARNKGVLVFASEIKAILQATEVSPIENPGTMDEYLCFRALSGTRTFFSGVELLAPGTILEVNPGGVTLHQYWKPSCEESLGGDPGVIRDTLSKCVCRQLMADVPLGTQLSGGVDSSWVSLLAADKAPGMKSFSVGFSEQAFDETPEAKEIASIGGLDYYEVKSNPATFAAALPKAIWYNDEPLCHANSVEIHNLCLLAKEHVKVLLTGEGADELFGGYPRYHLCRLGDSFRRLPTLLHPVFRLGMDWLSRGRGRKPSDFLGMNPHDLVFWNSSFANPRKIAWLLDKTELDLESRRGLLDSSWLDSLGILDNLLLYEFQSYLQPILLRQDKMSMGASVESRVPILDNEMVDLAFGIQASKKIQNMKSKFLFKEAAAIDLPASIVHKRKVGFGVPVGSWMRGKGPLSRLLEDLHGERRNLPDINPVKLEKVIREHQEGCADHQDILWPLLNYGLWRNLFLK